MMVGNNSLLTDHRLQLIRIHVQVTDYVRSCSGREMQRVQMPQQLHGLGDRVSALMGGEGD